MTSVGPSSGDDKLHVTPAPGLTHIAREVANDHSVEVFIGKPGGGSYANLDTRKLVLDPVHLEKGESMARFVAAHEGAHIRDTANFKQLGLTSQQVEELVKKLGLMALRNVVEDCAINDRFVRDYPPLGADTLEAYDRKSQLGYINHPEVAAQAKALGFVPKYAIALDALLSDWSELRHNQGFAESPENLKKLPYQGPAVEDEDIKGFIKISLGNFREAISKIYRQGANSDEMLLASIERHERCEKIIYPELAKLLQKDIEQFAENLKNKQNTDQEQAPSQGEVTNKEAERQAKEALSKFDDAIREALQSAADKQNEAPKAQELIKRDSDKERAQEHEAEKLAEFQEGTKHLRENIKRDLSPYLQYYMEVSDKVDEVYGRLVDVYIPNSHFGWDRGHPSGASLDMTGAMRFQLTNSDHNKIFNRRIDPQRADISIAVMIDRSGSMDGQKIKEAIKAALFSKELFQRLGIDCACIGFSDDQEILLDFEDRTEEYDNQERLMAGLTLEGGTQDASALDFAATLLREQSSKSKAIVMISDAQSGEAPRLSQVVKNIEAEGIAIIHFGIGADTSDQGRFYTKSFGDLSTRDGADDNFFEVFAREMENLATELL